MVCTLLAGVNVVAFAADGDLVVTVNKFYNDAAKGGDGEHLFTKDADEMSWLSSLPTWNNEGEAWKAPVSSSTSVYRCYNPNSGEHLYVDEGYADYLAGMGWNKEKLAFYSDDEMGTPVYRLWNGQDGVGSHHFTTDEGEVEWLVGQGWTAEDVAFYGIKEESSEVQLAPSNGFQSDGTVINTDTLNLVFGANFGVPSSIVWYKDGAVVGVFNGMTLTQGFTSEFLKDNIELTIPTGRYSVTVENTKGETFTTNTVTVVDQKALAVLSDYSITEDYTLDEDTEMADHIVYAPETDMLVVTVTMNRNDYTGVLGLIPTEAVMSGEATVADLVASASVDSTNPALALAPQFEAAESAKKFTDANVIDEVIADAIAGDPINGQYLDNKDGSRTYKWVVNTNVLAGAAATLTRGESYVLGFAQDDVSDPTDLETYAIAGMYSAPYVNAPIGIQLASVDVIEATHTAIFTIGIAEMGPLGPQKAEWLGAGDEIGGTLAVYGSEDITISEEDYDDMDEDPAVALNGGTMAALVMDPANDDYYFMATLTLDEGIYGPEELTFTSAVVEPAEEAAEGLTSWYFNAEYASEFNPADFTATVDSSFRTSGTLELYRNVSDDVWADGDTPDVDDSDVAEKVASAKVSKGVSTVTFRNAITKFYDEEKANQYTVKFVPDDTTEYKETVGEFVDDDVEFVTGTVFEAPARFVFAEKDIDAGTGAAVKVYNQFAKEITGNIDGYGMAFLPIAKTMKIVEVSAGSTLVPTVSILPDKQIVINATGNGAVVGDSYKLTLDNGQTVYAKVKAVDAGVPTKWTVSIQ